jgi:hypothetical protein
MVDSRVVAVSHPEARRDGRQLNRQGAKLAKRTQRGNQEKRRSIRSILPLAGAPTDSGIPVGQDLSCRLILARQDKSCPTKIRRIGRLQIDRQKALAHPRGVRTFRN